jgi:hypothetical protein
LKDIEKTTLASFSANTVTIFTVGSSAIYIATVNSIDLVSIL